MAGIALVLGGVAVAHAHETDQFTGRGGWLAEAEVIADQDMNRALAFAVRDANRASMGIGCARDWLDFFLVSYLLGVPTPRGTFMPRLQVDMERDSRIEMRWTPYSKSIYAQTRPRSRWGSEETQLDAWFRIWGLKPVMRLNGVEIGTDKIGHFLMAGKTYLMTELSARRRGLGAQAVEHAVFEHGRVLEEGSFGLKATGVKSWADLVANHRGLEFWKRVAGTAEPYIACEKGRFRLVREFRWSEYVDPLWDEAINCSTFTTRLARVVEQRLGQRGMQCPVDPELCRKHRDIANAGELVSPVCRAL